MKNIAIAVDLGGTSIKLGVVNSTGAIYARMERATPSNQSDDTILNALATYIQELMNECRVSKNEIVGIGLGIPGFIDPKTGVVILAPNIGWRNYPAQSILEQIIDLPVAMGNDANDAALGECWLGAAKTLQNIIMVTIGTGIGGGIVIGGEVVNGINGLAGEIGHITINPQGLRCGCGKVGCLETEASGNAIRRKAIELLKAGKSSSLQTLWELERDISPRQIIAAAQVGDALANQVLEKSANALAIVLSGLTHALNPEKIIIGGGISFAGDSLFVPLRKYFDQLTLPAANQEHLIVPAKLGNDAGMLGAAYRVFKIAP